jgi:hypothetical protein
MAYPGEREWRLVRIEPLHPHKAKRYTHLIGQEITPVNGRKRIKIQYRKSFRYEDYQRSSRYEEGHLVREVFYKTALEEFNNYFHSWWGVSSEQHEKYGGWLVFTEWNVGDDDMSDSNWRVLRKYFEETYPDDIYIIDRTISCRPFSKALYEAEEIARHLVYDYPVYDEDDYYQLETERARAAGECTDCYRGDHSECRRTKLSDLHDGHYPDKYYETNPEEYDCKCWYCFDNPTCHNPNCELILDSDGPFVKLQGLFYCDDECLAEDFGEERLAEITADLDKYMLEKSLLAAGYATLWDDLLVA